MYLRKLSIPLQASLMLSCFAISCSAQETAAWDQQATGRTSITRLGTIDYEVGYSSVGFDHFSSEIVARWNDGERRSRRCMKAFTTGRPPRSGERVPSVRGHADLRTLFGSLQPVCDCTPL